MVELTCESCGTEFDTDREGAHRHADTARCPSCGHKHEVAAEAGRITESSDPDPDSSDDVDEAIAVEGGATITVTITIDVEPS